MKAINTISLDDLLQLLDSGTTVEFWNVLTDEYFSGELIPGSRRVPLDQVGREVTSSRLDKDATIVVYCGGPRCPQSGMAAEKLATLGYTNVRSFEGGLEEWQSAGLEFAPPAAGAAAA